MIRILFGDVWSGRVKRLQYLGYSLLLALLVIGFGMAVALAIGVGEHIIGGDLQQAQDKLRGWFTLPFFFVFALVLGLFFFAQANIITKRLRDIGLPGWWVLLAIIILEVIISATVSEQAASGLHALVWVALMLIPGDTLAGSAPLRNRESSS